MKTLAQLARLEILQHLSHSEQMHLLTVRLRRSPKMPRVKKVKPRFNKPRHVLLLAALATGLFVTSATTVQAADESSGFSAPALFNEANAEQRAGRLGPAILNYERAQLLAPGDQAIAMNLRATRQKAGVSAPEFSAWESPAHWLSLDGMAGLASISLLLFSLLFFGRRLIPTTRRGLARGAAAALGVSALLAAICVAIRWPELDRAIVIGSHPAARIAPATDAATSFELKPGELVHAEGRYGDFVRIRSADGHPGWVTAADVGRVIPAAS
jgi:hypothetical protein